MIRRAIAVCCLLVMVAGGLVFAYDRSEFLFLDEIRIGMTGVGKTVVAGNVIEEFHVEVLGIIDQPGTLSDFIVVRVSGTVIGRAGGIAQGMSGSPIYIDGKLIGALSRAAHWSKEIMPIGLVTPIEPMLAVLDAARSHEPLAQPAMQAVLSDVRLADGPRPPSHEELAAAPDTLFAYPVAVPLITSGLSGRSLDILMHGRVREELPLALISDSLEGGILRETRGLSSYGLSLLPLSGSSSGASADAATLRPGGSIGVALTTGDITIGSLGTITYRDGDSLLAYGHRFIDNGRSAFPLTHVSVIDTLKSLQASFKLGTLGESVGTALEDRTAAVGGRLGPTPPLVQVTWDVLDTDRDLRERYVVGLVDEPRLMPNLLLATGFHAGDTTLDRVGQGTVEVSYRIEGDGMPRTLERTDLFISSHDVALYAPWQLASLVAYLQYNAFQDPQITSISASMTIHEQIHGIRIVGLSIDRPFYSPGDTLQYEIRLQTFQGEPFVEQGSLRIPHNLVTDFIVIRAYGGPRYLEAGESPMEFENIGDLIDAVHRIPSYDQLTVELFAFDRYSVDPSALYGVTERMYEYPGFVVYDTRSIAIPLLFDSTEGAPSSPEDAPSSGKGNG